MEHAPVELHVLGPTELRGCRTELDDANLRPPKRLALLTWLAIETADGYRRRDQIVGLFWPDLEQDAARAQLRKALFSIREGLGPDAILTRGESEVRLDPARTWCDAVALVQLTRQGRWPEALALYRGDLLEGLFAEGVAQEFEEWLTDRRKRLRAAAATAARECARLEEERGDRKAAAVNFRRAMELAPDDEQGIRDLMSVLDRAGDRGGALRVYSEWQARLLKEYGVEPAPETRKLARRVQAARKGESHETPPTPQKPTQLVLASTEPATHTVVTIERGWRLGVAIALPVILLTGLAAWALRGRDPAPAAPRSVAVLPLKPIGDSTLASLAMAIAEELTTALVADTALTVRPMARAKEAIVDGGEADRIGRALQVAYLLDGSIQRGADKLRINLRLVRTADGMAAWAGSFDLDFGDPSRLAQEVARAALPAIAARVIAR